MEIRSGRGEGEKREWDCAVCFEPGANGSGGDAGAGEQEKAECSMEPVSIFLWGWAGSAKADCFLDFLPFGNAAFGFRHLVRRQGATEVALSFLNLSKQRGSGCGSK